MTEPRTTVVSDRDAFPGNSRVARMSRWLAVPPEGAYAVYLYLRDDETGQEIRAASVPHVDRSAAGVIEDSIQSWMQETEASAHGKVSIVDADGRTLAERTVRAQYDTPNAARVAIDGNATSALRLVQEHQQVVIKSLEEMSRHLMTASVENLSRARDERRELIEENARLRAELEETKNDNAALVIESSASGETDPADMLREIVSGVREFKAAEGGGIEGILRNPRAIAAFQKLLRAEVARVIAGESPAVASEE